MSDLAPPSPSPEPPSPTADQRPAEPSSIPPPPGLPTATEQPAGLRAPRPGDVTPVWRAGLAAGWLGVFFAYAATWQASVQLGLATWWVGPRSTPQPAVIRAIPFFVAIVGLLLVIYNARRLSLLTFWLAALTLLIALPDFSTSVGLAVLEVLISVSMMVIAAASFTGRYRVSNTGAPPEAVDADGGPAPASTSPDLPAPPPPTATGSVDSA